jgi:hypothetical protein
MKYLNAIGKGKKKFPRYGCVKQPGTRNCGHIACSMNSVDRLVTTKLLAVIAAGRPIDHSGEVAQLETLLDEDKEALTELSRDRYLHRKIDAGTFETIRQEIEARITDVESRLTHVNHVSSTDIPSTPAELLAWWWDADVSDKRKVVERYISQVRVTPAKRRGGNVFDESRIEVDWR